MILSKIIVNQLVKYFVKHFQMDKIMNYVFDDNELDKKVKELDEEVKMLILMAHPKRDFVVCKKCNDDIEEARDKKWYEI